MYKVIFSSTTIDPSSCIDDKTTGTSYYDNFLNSKDLEYMETAKNRTGHIEYMTPLEYYSECATKVFNTSINSLKNQRSHDKSSIDYLTNVIESGRKYTLPYINYADRSQEGLHRMMVLGDYFGWDTKSFPVLVVDFVDERIDIINSAYKDLREAIDESLDFHYVEDTLAKDFVDQVDFEINKYALSDSIRHEVKLIKETDTQLIISLKGFEKDIKFEVSKDEINYRELEDEVPSKPLNLDDINLDDMDIEDLLKSIRSY